MATQVLGLYKDGSGEIRSILSRQFISFSYGGKNIEEFNLIATFSGDRLSKNIYSPFEDTTTQQEELDGQFYWCSKFGANELQFNLSTDGITQNELDEFKMWFKPGVERELILSENSNRAIMARVNTTPIISMLPFEYEEEVKIGEKKIKTMTTIFKGDITLSFTMDNPYWYSLNSYFPDNKINEVNTKIIFEDGVPYLDLFKDKKNILLSNNYIYNNNKIEVFKGVTIKHEGNIQEDASLYYCGTAPEKPTLTFSMNIEIDEKSKKAFFYKAIGDYYYIQIGKNKLLFSLPSLILAYNKVIDLTKSCNTIIDFQNTVRDKVYDYYVRAYAITLSNEKNASMSSIKNKMPDFFIIMNEKRTMNFYINCAKGITKITTNLITYGEIEENAGNMIKSPYLTISDDRSIIADGEVKNYLTVTTNSIINNFIIDYKYKYL